MSSRCDLRIARKRRHRHGIAGRGKREDTRNRRTQFAPTFRGQSHVNVGTYSGKVVIAVYAATPDGCLRKYDPYNPGMDPYGEIICEDIVYDPDHPLR